MTIEDLEHMKRSIQMYPAISRDPIWLRAFAEYNENHPNVLRLHMGCKVCYPKVYYFCKQQIEK